MSVLWDSRRPESQVGEPSFIAHPAGKAGVVNVFARGRHTGRGEPEVGSVCSLDSSEVLGWGQSFGICKADCPLSPLALGSTVSGFHSVQQQWGHSAAGTVTSFMAAVDNLSHLLHFGRQLVFSPTLGLLSLERHPWPSLSG